MPLCPAPLASRAGAIQTLWRRVLAARADPGRARDKISTLVFEAGFHDLSHFARAFRRRYGDTPSGMRAGALPPKESRI